MNARCPSDQATLDAVQGSIDDPLVPLWLAMINFTASALCFLAIQVTERTGVGVGGVQGNNGSESGFGRSVSADGRFVVFTSQSDNLVPGDTHPAWDAFLRDRQAGTTELVNLDSAGVQGGGAGFSGVVVTDDGRYVGFSSVGADLVPGDTNGSSDVFLRDRWSGTTERISVSSTGVEGDASSAQPFVTNDGRYVVFASAATNLVSGDTNGLWDSFVRDRLTGTTERVNVATNGAQSDGDVGAASISGDGRYVAFCSYATNLVSGDTNGRPDGFVRDRLTGVTQRVSVASDGSEGNDACVGAVISDDGRIVAFSSYATNMVPGDTNATYDVFVRDLLAGTTDIVSVGYGGTPANGYSYSAWPSADGRYIAFQSWATNLLPAATAGGNQIFVCDRQGGSIELVSTMTGGAQSNGQSSGPSISSDGRFVTFRSTATNLVPGDTNGMMDVFIHDRAATGFTSFCDPGLIGVIACPCGNPPSQSGRGCDNSSGTGGAALSASGIAYLSLDSIVFTTLYERPLATSILLQGDAVATNGLVFGQGVRCAAGTLKRLYVKTAINGSITAPELSAGDLSVSARSAQLGLPIQPGQPHIYQVYYRDPFVLGGCFPSSTFNATQAGRVQWWP